MILDIQSAAAKGLSNQEWAIPVLLGLLCAIGIAFIILLWHLWKKREVQNDELIKEMTILSTNMKNFRGWLGKVDDIQDDLVKDVAQCKGKIEALESRNGRKN